MSIRFPREGRTRKIRVPTRRRPRVNRSPARLRGPEGRYDHSSDDLGKVGHDESCTSFIVKKVRAVRTAVTGCLGAGRARQNGDSLVRLSVVEGPPSGDDVKSLANLPHSQIIQSRVATLKDQLRVWSR